MENNTDNTKNTKRWSKGGQNSLEDATNPHKIRASADTIKMSPILELAAFVHYLEAFKSGTKWYQMAWYILKNSAVHSAVKQPGKNFLIPDLEYNLVVGTLEGDRILHLCKVRFFLEVE